MSGRLILKSAVFLAAVSAVPFASAQSDLGNDLFAPSIASAPQVPAEPGAPAAMEPNLPPTPWSRQQAAAAPQVMPAQPSVLPSANSWAGAPAQPQAPLQPGQNPFAAGQGTVEPAAVIRTSAAAPMPGQNPFATQPPVAASQGQTAAEPFSLSGDAPASQSTTAEAEEPVEDQGPDETALRYYASKRDLQRVGAEMRRLKSLYPDWRPPSDLFAQRSSIDEQPLWDLFAASDYAALRAKIANFKSANPNWVPSADLIDKLGLAEARVSVERAHRSSNWGQVVTIANAMPNLLTCDNMQTLWFVGDALAKSGDYARSFELYKYVLANCQNPNERLATVQKASMVLPARGVDSLIMLGRQQADGSKEFDDMRFARVRLQMGQVSAGDAMAQNPDPELLRQFADYVQRTRSGKDAALFGWYYYSQEEWRAAYAWFAAGTYASKDPKLLEGVVLTLRKMGESERALKIADQVRGHSRELQEQYIQLVSSILTDEESGMEIAEAQLETFRSVVTDTRSALGAQAIGWSHVAKDELDEAAPWFQNSVKWEETEGGVLGLAVIASRQKDSSELKAIKARYEYDSLDDFKIHSPPKRSSKRRASSRRKGTRVAEKRQRKWPFPEMQIFLRERW